MTPQTDTHWLANDPGIAIPASARAHFPPALSAYGPLADYDLADPRGFLAFVIRFVNRTERAPGPVRPVGRERLRELLETAASRPEELARPSDELLQDVRSRLSGITWLARLERTPTGSGICHHAMLSDVGHIYAVLAIVLMDAVAREALGQCQHCSKFFLVEARSRHEGRPQRKFCSTEHAEEAHAGAAAGRQLQARARRRLEKRYGREASRRAVKLVYEHNPEVITMAEQLADRARSLVPTIKHFVEIVERAFPDHADIAQREQSGDLCLFIDWKLGTDQTRPNKRSKSILVRISHEAIDDYTNSDERQRKAADSWLKKYLVGQIAAFEPDHDTPRHMQPPREEWIVSTHNLNP